MRTLIQVFVFSLLLIFVWTNSSVAQEEEDLLSMSLEELMDIEVEIGTLTPTKLSRIPVSVTTITKEQIAVTPARSVADLLEIYVPGATFNAQNNPRIGIRGIMIDRNYKILLLVNGKNMNHKSALGAELEISNWDLNDIERIEVIRGPGSATYGPGAIAGIINIITKTAKTAEGFEIGSAFVSEYHSYGGHASYGYKGKDSDFYAYFSFRNTEGLQSPDVFRIHKSTGEHGFVGKDYLPDTELSPYCGDILDPQFKAHIDYSFAQDWRFWARYTSSGSSAQLLDGPIMVDYAGQKWPGRFTDRKSLALVLENERPFLNSGTIRSSISYDTEHTFMIRNAKTDRKYNQGIFKYTPDLGNVIYNSAENEILAQTLVNFKLQDKHDIAIGGSFSYEWLRPSDWYSTDIQNDYVATNVQNRLTSDGGYIQDKLGKGFETHSFAIFGEATFTVHPLLDVLVAGRIDKNKWSEYLFSPRIGLVSQPTERDTFKAVYQRSNRMNTLTELYIENDYGRDGEPETLDSFELMYVGLLHKNLTTSITAFYNHLGALGWSGSESKTIPIGEMDTVGLEAELRLQTDRWTVGVNHSALKLLDWESANGVTSQGISYSDYDFSSGGVTFTGHGNSLTNVPEHMTKLYVDCRDLIWDINAHLDVSVLWDYPGLKDGLKMYEDAHQAQGGDATMDQLAHRMKREDYGDANIKLNLSVSRTWETKSSEITVSVFGMNLLGFQRYFYQANSKAYPDRSLWVEEPAVVGVSTKITF